MIYLKVAIEKFIYQLNSFTIMPKKISKKERIYLEIEKSKIQREKASIVLNKNIMLFFCFLFIGVIGFVFEYIESFLLNVLVIIGILILLLGTIPYVIITNNEEKKIDELLKGK